MFLRAFACERSNLNCSNGFTGFAARNRKHAFPIGARSAPIRFGDVKACTLGSAQRLIAQFRIPDLRLDHCDQQVTGNAIRDQIVVGK